MLAAVTSVSDFVSPSHKKNLRFDVFALVSTLYTELVGPCPIICLTSPSLKLFTGTCFSCVAAAAAAEPPCSFFAVLPAAAEAGFCAAAL